MLDVFVSCFPLTEDALFPSAALLGSLSATPPVISGQRAGEVGFILFSVSFMQF